MITRVVQCPFDFFGVDCVYAVRTDKGGHMVALDRRYKGEGYVVYDMPDSQCGLINSKVYAADTLDACKDYIQRNA